MTNDEINILDVLEKKHNYILKCYECLLEMVEEDLVPYIAPVNYVYQIQRS